MRRILSQLIVLNLLQVQKFDEFSALIEEGDGVAKDDFHKMSRGMELANKKMS